MERHRRNAALIVDKRQYSARVQIDDTDPRITYQQSNWYAAQNMTGRGYNGTATMTMTNDSWLQLPYSGGSLTLGLLHNGVAFSGVLGLDDGTSHKIAVPASEESTANSTVLTPQSFRYDHLACGNHTATLTIDLANDTAGTRPEVYFDWYSYPLPNDGDCAATGKDATGTGSSGALNLSAAAPELKTVAITVASIVAGIFILGILACLLRHRRQKYETKKRGILGFHHGSKSTFDPPSTDEQSRPLPSVPVGRIRTQQSNKSAENPARPSRPDNGGEQDRRQIDAMVQPLSVFQSTSTEPAAPPKRASWWSGMGIGKAKAASRFSLDGRAGTPNFSLPTSLQPKPDQNISTVEASFESSDVTLGPRTSQLAYLQNETPTTACMSLSAVKPVAPLFASRRLTARPRTAPERLVKYTSGSADSGVMFEMVDSRDAKHAGTPVRPQTAQADDRKSEPEERVRMPSIDTQWSRASATDNSVMIHHNAPVLAHLIDDYAPSQAEASTTVVLARLLDDYIPSQSTDVDNSVETLAPRWDVITPPPSASPTSRARSPCSPPRPLKSAKRKRLDLDTDAVGYQSFTARLGY